MNYTENVIVPERTLLVSLDTGEYDAEESLRELWELAKSGGAEPIATMMQKRPSPETATCVGSGMVEEIRNFCENNEIELIIFDREARAKRSWRPTADTFAAELKRCASS